MAYLEVVARWWTQAPQEERYALFERAIHGDPNAPSLSTLQTAILLAEVENGEVGQG